MYAEIGADTSKLEKGLKDTKKKLGDVGNEANKTGRTLSDSFTSFTKTAAIASGSLLAVYGTMKKIYDVGKEGAALEYAADKFDRLAESAGTTAEVLLNDLQTAVKGTRSDMELMASAGDFMSLGLAKTHDEVVRLTRVAGALNMNMNQLVLTLTNQTTMRFDALGVAVDGFEDKVKELEKAGYSASDAFQEAFLRQAEEQIGRVGDAADTNAGKIMRFEASIKNLGDSIKLKLAGPIADAADGLNILMNAADEAETVWEKHEKEMRLVAESYEEYREEMIRSGMVANVFTGQTAQLARMVQEGRLQGDALTQAMLTLGNALPIVTEREWAFIQAAADGRIQVQTYADEVKNADTALNNMASAAETAKAKILGLNDIDLSLASTIESELNKIDYYLAGGLPLQQVTEDIQAALASGKITPEQAKEMFGEAFIAEQALQVELGNITADQAAANVRDTLGKDLGDAKQLVLDTKAELDTFPKELHTTLYIHIIETGEAKVDAISPDLDDQHGGEQEGIGHASGGSFTIPAGYPNDSFYLGDGNWGQSGETVTISPPGLSGGGNQPAVVVYADVANQVDVEALAYRIEERIINKWRTH